MISKYINFFKIKHISTKIAVSLITLMTISIVLIVTTTSIIFSNTVVKNKIDILNSEITITVSQLSEKIKLAKDIGVKLRNDQIIQDSLSPQRLTPENIEDTSLMLSNYLSNSSQYKPNYINKILTISNDLVILDPLYSAAIYGSPILDNVCFQNFQEGYLTSRFSNRFRLPADLGNNQTINFMVKYLNKNNYEQLGYLLIGFKVPFFFDFINNSNSPFEDITIINRDNTLIYSSQDITPAFYDYISTNLDQLDLDNYQATIDNKQTYMFSRVVPIYRDWIVVGTISKTAIYKDIYKLILMISLIGIVTNIIVIFIGIYVSKKITRPIQTVLDAMESVEKGIWPEPIVPFTDDEFRKLAVGFNNMANSLETSVENIILKQEEKKEAEILALQFQLEMLHYQINPHFIYNTLNAISAIALKRGETKIRESIQSFSALLKHTLAADEEFFSIEKEVNCLETFLDIQRLRYGDIFELKCHVDESIKDVLIPKFTLQPLVENALFHGIVPLQQGTIKIDFEKIDSNLKITVSDNGVGIRALSIDEIINNTKQYTGAYNNIGLKNINERLELYFGSAYQLELDTTVEVGTSIYFYIPLYF